jgi:hypothetical protein
MNALSQKLFDQVIELIKEVQNHSHTTQQPYIDYLIRNIQTPLQLFVPPHLGQLDSSDDISLFEPLLERYLKSLSQGKKNMPPPIRSLIQEITDDLEQDVHGERSELSVEDEEFIEYRQKFLSGRWFPILQPIGKQMIDWSKSHSLALQNYLYEYLVTNVSQPMNQFLIQDLKQFPSVFPESEPDMDQMWLQLEDLWNQINDLPMTKQQRETWSELIESIIHDLITKKEWSGSDYMQTELGVYLFYLYLQEKFPLACIPTLDIDFILDEIDPLFYGNPSEETDEFILFSEWIHYLDKHLPKIVIQEDANGQIQLLPSRLFETTFQDCLKSNKPFIVIPLVIETNDCSHGNILVIDTATREIERFEPHGVVSYDRGECPQQQIDELLETYFRDFIYYSPKQICTYVGPQKYFEENMLKYGFCLTWSWLYGIERLNGMPRNESINDVLLEKAKAYKKENYSDFDAMLVYLYSNLEEVNQFNQTILDKINDRFGTQFRIDKQRLVFPGEHLTSTRKTFTQDFFDPMITQMFYPNNFISK